jgi:hypothetical protein
LGVLPGEHLARLVPRGSKFRLNIDFAVAGKNVSGGNCPVGRDTRQKFPGPGNPCRVEWANNSTFQKINARKIAKILEKSCATPAQHIANKDERDRAQARAGAQTK